MEKFGVFVLDFLAQFGGGRGDIHNELVRTSLEATFWAALLALSLGRRRMADSPREKVLLLAFGFGLLRAVLLFLVFALEILGIFAFRKSHLFFPPLEHAFLLASVVLVAGGFVRFLVEGERAGNLYLTVGMSVVTLDYASTALGWMRHILANPGSRFGLVWGDQLFHLSGVALVAWAIALLWRTRGTVRNLVLVAMVLFLLDDALQMFNLAGGDRWGEVLGPIRHNLHNLAIPLLGGVYVVELFREWRAAEGVRARREDRYRRLFTMAEKGVLQVELVRDPAGHPLDYRIIDINRTGESVTGIVGSEAIGQLGSVVLRGPRPPLLRTLAWVDSQGLDRVLRLRSRANGKVYLLEMFPLTQGRIAVTISGE